MVLGMAERCQSNEKKKHEKDTSSVEPAQRCEPIGVVPTGAQTRGNIVFTHSTFLVMVDVGGRLMDGFGSVDFVSGQSLFTSRFVRRCCFHSRRFVTRRTRFGDCLVALFISAADRSHEVGVRDKVSGSSPRTNIWTQSSRTC